MAEKENAVNNGPIWPRKVLTAPEREPIIAIIDNELGLEALGSNLIIKEDKFRTGYECKTCDGEGVQENTTCPSCNGQKWHSVDNDQIPCRLCRGTGKRLCESCNGKGGLLIVPEESMRRPTSGVIVSLGPDVKTLQKGDRILYSNFTGHAINFKQNVVFRIMHEHECFTKLHGIGDLQKRLK